MALNTHNVIHAISELFERLQVVERNLDEELQNLDSNKYQAFTINYGTMMIDWAWFYVCINTI